MCVRSYVYAVTAIQYMMIIISEYINERLSVLYNNYTQSVIIKTFELTMHILT